MILLVIIGDFPSCLLYQAIGLKFLRPTTLHPEFQQRVVTYPTPPLLRKTTAAREAIVLVGGAREHDLNLRIFISKLFAYVYYKGSATNRRSDVISDEISEHQLEDTMAAVKYYYSSVTGNLEVSGNVSGLITFSLELL